MQRILVVLLAAIVVPLPLAADDGIAPAWYLEEIAPHLHLAPGGLDRLTRRKIMFGTCPVAALTRIRTGFLGVPPRD